MNIDNLAKEWKEFKKRQDRISARNIHSDEYHKAVNQAYNEYTSSLWKFDLKQVLNQDMYENSIEGMLNWVNDGRPE